MNVLHIVSGELTTGASRGAFWLHQGLLEIGCNSFLLNNGRFNPKMESITSLANTSYQKIKRMILPRIAEVPKALYPNRKPWIFNTGFEGMDFMQHPAYKSADLVHLHWINGLVSIRSLSNIKKPIVWTLRDMWPMTGGCHYSMGCTRYEKNCGQCPQLSSNNKFDLSAAVIANKKMSLPKHMQIVGVSSWLSDCARRSAVFRDFKIKTIGNNIPTSDFFPIDPNIAREALSLPKEKKIILIGAQSINDFYKSPDLLEDTINLIEDQNIHFVIFGTESLQFKSVARFPCTYMGYLKDTISLRLVYSASDVFVAPSRMDAFPKTTIEAMSCGTPVACFDATGFIDIVKHKTTGYKAKPFEPADLANGINWILSLNENGRYVIRKNSRRHVIDNFDSKIIASKYYSLYKELIGDI